jgi:sugar phosphate isomerase/epimerase
MVLDTFHFFATDGRPPDIAFVDVNSLAIVHVSDASTAAPVAELSDKDRTLLGSGSFPLAEAVETLLRHGYTGFFSLELFNPRLWEYDPFSLARTAYANLLTFLGPDET